MTTVVGELAAVSELVDQAFSLISSAKEFCKEYKDARSSYSDISREVDHIWKVKTNSKPLYK
jgi:hypothetical protein